MNLGIDYSYVKEPYDKAPPTVKKENHLIGR